MVDIRHIANIGFEVLFEDLPDWAIPMMHVIPVFYTEDAYDLDGDDITFYHDFNYMWVKVDDNYKLLIRLSGQLLQLVESTYVTLPLFVNLDCYFLNENIYQEIQHERG